MVKIGTVDIEQKERMFLNRKVKIRALTFAAKSTLKNFREGKHTALGMNYKLVQRYVEANKETMFANAKKIQINVLTPQGWRAGVPFKPSDTIKWFNQMDAYSEEFDVTTVFAVQILKINDK